jgi:transposase
MGHYIGMDFHKQFSQVAVMDQQGQIIEERRLDHDQLEGLKQYFSQFDSDTSIALEATRGWYWMVDFLQNQGFDVKLVHAKKARIIAESTIKTDKVDAKILAHLNRCNFLPEAYIASPQRRSERELLRYHISLVKIQTSLKNRIHGILSKHNIQQDFTDVFGRSGREFLKDLALPTIFRLELDGYLDVLDKVSVVLSQAKKQIDHHCHAWPEAALLTSVPGIGVYGALLLAAEIADINRFGNIKKFCCYAGVVPSTHQSANKIYHGRIIKDSNKYIRFVALEAVKHAIKQDPKLRHFYQSIEKAKGKNKARIATARKLLVSIYHMLKDHAVYKIAHKNHDRQANPCSGLGTIVAP